MTSVQRFFITHQTSSSEVEQFRNVTLLR